MRVRQVTDPRDPAIDAFGAMQTAAYFAPETLIPARYIPYLLENGTGPRRNFLIVAEEDHHVVGGALFHWLASAGSGFSSFLGVCREARRQGVARALHEERFRILDDAAGGHVSGVFIDVVNPLRLSPEDFARERRAGSDPWDRRRAFERLGFRQVDIRYEQPVGGPNGGPVTVLDLLYCPHEPADSVRTSLVINTMLAYWSGWLGDAAQHHARELEARAQGADNLRLVSSVPPRPQTMGHTYK
jgi:GNAT superfamily N-acetyltransferase